MKAIRIFLFGVLTGFCCTILPAHAASTTPGGTGTAPADTGKTPDAPPASTADTPAVTPETANTTQARLDAVQQAIVKVHGQLRSATTENKGGFVEKARDDLNLVMTDLKEANAYVSTHPEVNTLTLGPTPPEPKELQPSPTPIRGARPNLNTAIEYLNVALTFLVNNSAHDYRGPIMGDLDGLRQKIITDIVATATDVLAAADYSYANPVVEHKSNTKLDPLSPDQLKALVIVKGDYGQGTGFVAKMHNEFFIVTNLHVLSGDKSFTMTGMDGAVYPTNGQLYGSVQRDVAILRIPPAMAKYYLEIMTDPIADAKPQDLVTVAGNSIGAGVPLQINGRVLGVGPEFVEVDAKFVEGNSGSPIIHRPSGQVIGIATFTKTYNLDSLSKAADMKSLRWFGTRIDNINPNDWELLDWARFSAEGQKVREVEDTTSVLLALIENEKLPLESEQRIIDAVVNYQTSVATAIKRRSTPDFTDAVSSFIQRLQDITSNDFADLINSKMYSYHAKIIKQQQALWKAVGKLLADEKSTLGPLKNTY